MVTYALSPAMGPALVSRLDAEYMSGLPPLIEGSAYLNPELKGALLDCYERGPSPRCMKDAHALGLLVSELADDWSQELSAEAVSIHGPGRLFAEPPTGERSGAQIRDMTEVVRRLAEIFRHGDPSAIVLELEGMKRDPSKTRIQTILPRLMRGRIGEHALHVGRAGEGFLRIPSLSILQTALRAIYGDSAPQFCSAAYLISPGLLNDLHELDFRMLALLLSASSFDERKDQSPLEALFHDIEHTLDYVQLSPFVRRVGAQCLCVLEDYCSKVPKEALFRNALLGKYTMRMLRKLIMDLQTDLGVVSHAVLETFNPEYGVVIGRHCLSAFEAYRSSHTLSPREVEKLHRAKTILLAGLATIEQDAPVQRAAVA